MVARCPRMFSRFPMRWCLPYRGSWLLPTSDGGCAAFNAAVRSYAARVLQGQGDKSRLGPGRPSSLSLAVACAYAVTGAETCRRIDM